MNLKGKTDAELKAMAFQPSAGDPRIPGGVSFNQKERVGVICCAVSLGYLKL
jgi:hypothetical protein